MLRKSTTSEKGFTLVELMVVVALLGILAAAALPVLGNFRERAKISNGVVSARCYINAVQSYATSNPWNGYPNIRTCTELRDLGAHHGCPGTLHCTNLIGPFCTDLNPDTWLYEPVPCTDDGTNTLHQNFSIFWQHPDIIRPAGKEVYVGFSTINGAQAIDLEDPNTSLPAGVTP